MRINWQQFGLKTNPYDTFPLVEGGELSLEEAFVGREAEMSFLEDLFESEKNACLTVCGDTGVGKTSLANVQKFVWKYKKEKLLFSSRREIEATDTLLDKQSFLLEIIGSVLREIKLLDPKLFENPFLEKLNTIIDLTQMIAISGGISADYGGFGGGLSLSKGKSNFLPPRLTTAAVEQHFANLLDFVKTTMINGLQYSGLIVHVNNFDVILQEKDKRKKVISFFNEIRDILQTKDVYFLFLGPSDFYTQIVAQEQRVKSIFARTPLVVRPLSRKEVASAFERRMQLLQSPNVQRYIKPIDDEVVYRLYALYDGDIRSIMTGIKDILTQCSDRLLQPLTMNEAMILLGRERWDGIKDELTKEQRKILEFLVREKKYISINEAARMLHKQASNISGYYFKPLKDRNVIEEKVRKGRTIYLGLTVEYEPLKWLFESGNSIQEDIKIIQESQPTLFTEGRI